MKNLDLKDIPAQFLALFQKIRRYSTFIFVIGLFLVFSFLVYRINALNSLSPSDADISAKLKTVQQPVINSALITKIQQLQDNSVQVQSLFNSARNNPFQE